ncbi:KH domain-containing, RNA-binding, signal transduction-associated protein 2-like isoform X2 [Physella acuta]|uniref:KH domain-containing, RNA-binding, signal transduction-associated protein 2-like isoform X2 n=1 Tax=Physella acuta TaxID=109671 RepID=UPI0027DB5322|nr:KH domain-containing, RNA-binding, signal transduction-associated protein 2-like isoform X2 [Physella acuta]
MAQTGTYREELENELKQTDPNSHSNRLIAQEIDRLTKGEDDKKERPAVPMYELHNDRQQRCSLKIKIPIKEHPKYNFVGKLLGPKGQTLKALQDQTGCKMAIMGKGSMREKEKEEELRKEGGKYAHLNEDLHVLVECFTDVTDGYHRLAAALLELRKFVIPDLADEMYGGGDMGIEEIGMNGGGAPRGRGAYRGAPPERGGRGAFRGRGNGPAPPPPAGRGGPPPATRGAPPPRGAPRGAPSSRGAPPSRGAPSRGARVAAPSASYDGYSSQGYGSGYGTSYDSSYDEGYGQSYSAGQDAAYYDYGGPSATSSAAYDSYGSAGGYGDYDSWGTTGGKAPPPSSRGAARAPARSHPYSRAPQGGGY